MGEQSRKATPQHMDIVSVEHSYVNSQKTDGRLPVPSIIGHPEWPLGGRQVPSERNAVGVNHSSNIVAFDDRPVNH